MRLFNRAGTRRTEVRPKNQDWGNSNKRSKTDNKAIKKMIKAAVASALSQLSECGIKYDKEEKNIHTQESSTNTNKKVHFC